MKKILYSLLGNYNAIKDLIVLIIGGYFINITLATWNEFSIYILLFSIMLSLGLILILFVSKAYGEKYEKEKSDTSRTITKKKEDVIDILFKGYKTKEFYQFLTGTLISAISLFFLIKLTICYQNENNSNQSKNSIFQIKEIEKSINLILKNNDFEKVENEKKLNELKESILIKDKKNDSLMKILKNFKK